MNDYLPPIEPLNLYFERTENLPKEQQHIEYEKRSALKKLHQERDKKKKDLEDMRSSPVYRQMIVDRAIDLEKVRADIEKLSSKIVVARGQYESSHTVNTDADEFMLAKWEVDKQSCLSSWDKSISSQQDQILQMRSAFEAKLRAVENNLEGTRNSRRAKEDYYDKRIKATQDRIDLAHSQNKNPAIVKLELELQELEAKRSELEKPLDSS